MILIAQKKLANNFKFEGQKSYLSLLPRMWQELEELPDCLKNGKNWLLSEEIIKYSHSNFEFDRLELYLLSEKVTNHSKKYIVNLSLELTGQEKIFTKINLTLLSEDSWNEIIQKNQ